MCVMHEDAVLHTRGKQRPQECENEGVISPGKSAVEKEGVWTPKECVRRCVGRRLDPLKGTGLIGGCAKSPNAGKGPVRVL